MGASSESVLAVLPKARLVDLGRDVGVPLDLKATKDQQIKLLLDSGRIRFNELLQRLGRDELQAACRAHDLPADSRARAQLQQRLHESHGSAQTAPPPPRFEPREIPGYAPRKGDVVVCRHRQWLVEQVDPPADHDHATRVCMVCLDDDNQGQVTETFWELELGAKVLARASAGTDIVVTGKLPEADAIDQPRHFGAYLHALKWNSVTATDAKLFQAPFRAGIRLMPHQLTPLTKALALPRANLFIADDVGLGKTIEAGLVLQELLLRQQVEFVLVICPASVQLQWKEEMAQRFGLQFEVMSRHFIARRRKERGFGINPWNTHRRFIVSHPIVRRPEYREELLAHLQSLGAVDAGLRARKSLLILDEAHVAAPASASKWATDSEITRVIRDIAPRFENRLFLSATPHNGHSNSFSALLEILDPQRFTRAVPIKDPKRLRPVMVRRLKEDLREQEGIAFPKRLLVQVELKNDGDEWNALDITYDRSENTRTKSDARSIGEAHIEGSKPVELRLSAMLADYTKLMRPKKGRGKLVFINLQKRLLSSIPAFYRTLRVHAERIRGEKTQVAQLSIKDDDELGIDDETLDAADEATVASATAELSLEKQAETLLDEMLALAAKHQRTPDAKMLALLDWIRQHQCAVATPGGHDKPKKQQRAWQDTRVLIFTEYGDTRKYIVELIQTAIRGTDLADERIAQLYGGMNEEQRADIQRAFNAPPDQHPVRILVATDAAREGINLQGACQDLFHFDVPWNPGRLEQRNGRIDRTLQPSPVVRCHYFRYADRAADVVLERLVDKVDVIQRELGSLGAVVMERIDKALSEGITEASVEQLDLLSNPAGKDTVASELESQRAQRTDLQEELQEAGEILEKSKRVMEFDHALLRDAIDVGLELSGAQPLQPAGKNAEGIELFELPDMPTSWSRTVDHLRPPKRKDEEWWQWRKQAPLPVVFDAPKLMSTGEVHLHLSHPFVQRVLGRFLAQGYSAHDLSRVTIVKSTDHLTRVIAFGRLCLYGQGAARLHDCLISVAGQWKQGQERDIKPFADEADRKAIDMVERVLAGSPSLGVSEVVRKKVLGAAPMLFEQLWKRVAADADAEAHRATEELKKRGREEADALRKILLDQRNDVQRSIAELSQTTLDFGTGESDQKQKRQRERDLKHLKKRHESLRLEREREPRLLETLYGVVLKRLEPVGLIVLWPESRS